MDQIDKPEQAGIEVTEAMVEAGVDVVFEKFIGEVEFTGTISLHVMVREIVLASLGVQKRQLSP